MITFLKKLFKTTDYTSLLKKGAVVIDVRNGAEFDAGHIGKAKNIPLERLSERIIELKNLNVPIICCCMSGVRSGIAAHKLKNNGVDAYNGGGWQSLASKLNKIAK
jgi:phage shock protein E